MTRILSSRSIAAIEGRKADYRYNVNTMSRNSLITAVETMAFDIESLVTEIERLKRESGRVEPK